MFQVQKIEDVVVDKLDSPPPFLAQGSIYVLNFVLLMFLREAEIFPILLKVILHFFTFEESQKYRESVLI